MEISLINGENNASDMMCILIHCNQMFACNETFNKGNLT